jgi:hypothetical protein
VRGAILITGSLLWHNDQREVWRTSRLLLEKRFHAKVPICYGRVSTSHSKTFTMTFGPFERLGQGVLVPCRLAIGDAQGLFTEAQALWKAEKAGAKAFEIGAEWGCVGVLFQESKESLKIEWEKYFRVNASSVWPVSTDGRLSIPWPIPTADGTGDDVQVILAIATKAEVKPSMPEEIADAWLGQQKGHERYFFENVRYGIRTPDDGLIWKRLEERNPPWLANNAYQEAIAVLRAETSEPARQL